MTSDTGKTIETDQELTALDGAPVSATPVPGEVVIVPWGEVQSTNGRFTVDEESARLAVEAFEEHGCDLPIDYEHQTLGGPFTSPTGQAPAAGWIKQLRAQPGVGLVAEVRWTEPALEQLAARQYRYLSPVAIVRKSDRKLVGVHSVALTNKPAIIGMRPIVNAQAPVQATDEALPVHCVGAQGDTQAGGRTNAQAGAQASVQAAERLRRRLELDPACSDEEVLVAAAQRVVELEEQSRLRQAEDRVAAAMAQGKLTPAQRPWAVRLCLRDELLFDEWLSTAAVVVQPGRSQPPGGQSADTRATAIAARARAEYRADPTLAALTSEEAYVADALRTAG